MSPGIGIGIGLPFGSGRGGGVPALTLIAVRGAFAWTGQAATLKKTHKLAAAAASFAFNGQAMTMPRTRRLIAEAASFAWTGQAATLTIATPDAFELNAQSGEFVWTGDTMTPVVDYKLPAGAASFAFSGQASSLELGRKLVAAGATFTFTGQAATLTNSTPSYAGPGSVAGWSGAYEYWGLRGYDATKIGSACIDICSNATGAPSGLTTINVGSDGYVDATAIAATGFGTYYVDRFYGQINGRHLNFDAGDRAILTLNQIAGKPILTVVNGTEYATASNVSALAQPMTVAAIARFANSFAELITADGFDWQPLGSILDLTNRFTQCGGGRADYTAGSNINESLISVVNGASSSMCVDGSVSTTGTNVGTNGITGSTKLRLFSPGGGTFFGGGFYEVMIKDGAVSPTNQGLLSTNQHAIGTGW